MDHGVVGGLEVLPPALEHPHARASLGRRGSFDWGWPWTGPAPAGPWGCAAPLVGSPDPSPRSPGGCPGSQGGLHRQCLAPLFAHLSRPCYPDPGAGPTSPTLLPF